MRTGLVVAVLAVASVVTGCADREFRDASAVGDLGSATSPWVAGAAGETTDVPECAAFGNAPPSSPDALIGTWGYINAMLFSAGYEPMYAEAVGTLLFGADGRYELNRQIGGTGLAYGSGTWTFDGEALTLTPDDGTDPDTYDHVIATDVALTLVSTDETGCTVYLLGGQP